MQALIIDAADPLCRKPLLGLSLATRAVFAAGDSGVEAIELDGTGADLISGLAADARMKCPVQARGAESGEYLIVRADALVGASLLAELEPGEGLADTSGVLCAARVELGPSDDPHARLAAARPRAFSPDRQHYALHVRDASLVPAARKLLLESLIKKVDGPVSRHFNRHFSRAITRVCVPLGVTPNMMTAMVAIAGAAGAYFASQPSYQLQLLGAFLYQVHSVIDGCDGEIARLTRNFGKHGALLDSLVDDASNAAFWGGLSCGTARLLGVSWPFYTGAFALFCYAIVVFVQISTVLRRTGKGEKTAFWDDQSGRPWLARALHALGRRDVFVLVILIAVAFGLAPIVVAILPMMAFGALVQSIKHARSA